MNWTDVDVLSDAGVNWVDLDVLSDSRGELGRCGCVE